MPLLVRPRLDEELHLHLLELAHAEDEVPGGDLVPEGLPDLRDPERDLATCRLLHRREVHEHPLSGLGSEVDVLRSVFDGTHVRPEHQVEVARVRERVVATVGAGLRVPRQIVRTEPLVAVPALDERVREDLEVPARLPYLRRHDDGRVEPDDVVAHLHHRTPPRVLDVALQLDPERPVVPRRAQASVDLGRREDDAAAFRERGDLFHQVGHDPNSLPGRWERPLAWEEW